MEERDWCHHHLVHYEVNQGFRSVTVHIILFVIDIFIINLPIILIIALISECQEKDDTARLDPTPKRLRLSNDSSIMTATAPLLMTSLDATQAAATSNPVIHSPLAVYSDPSAFRDPAVYCTDTAVSTHTAACSQRADTPAAALASV
jgi:hypothetical protein